MTETETVEPNPILTSDYQIANRWSFNFITSKTKAGYKCISLPVGASRDVLLAAAIEEFKRWEARVA